MSQYVASSGFLQGKRRGLEIIDNLSISFLFNGSEVIDEIFKTERINPK